MYANKLLKQFRLFGFQWTGWYNGSFISAFLLLISNDSNLIHHIGFVRDCSSLCLCVLLGMQVTDFVGQWVGPKFIKMN
jgi:hypothetical protein